MVDRCNNGERKRLPRLAASLMVHVASGRELTPGLHRASLSPPTPVHVFGEHPSASAGGGRSSTFDLLLPQSASEDASPTRPDTTKALTLDPPALVEDSDSDSDMQQQDCPSLISLSVSSERESSSPWQINSAECSSKRVTRTGGRLTVLMSI